MIGRTKQGDVVELFGTLCEFVYFDDNEKACGANDWAPRCHRCHVRQINSKSHWCLQTTSLRLRYRSCRAGAEKPGYWIPVSCEVAL